jgi:hypothetical protein
VRLELSRPTFWILNCLKSALECRGDIGFCLVGLGFDGYAREGIPTMLNAADVVCPILVGEIILKHNLRPATSGWALQ